MSYALIEVEAMAKKAARGAGYSWGMAEEAAKAASWLCAQGLDGVAVLARALASDAVGAGSLDAATGLSDTAASWQDTGTRMEAVSVPALVLPFVAYAARQLGKPTGVSWPGAQVVTDGRALSLHVENDAALLAPAGVVTVNPATVMGAAQPLQTRANPSPDDWQALADLAQRTYAPETDESRLKGAGAGLNDND